MDKMFSVSCFCIEKTDGQSDVVTLSPSAVDSLWACPVCWMLENRFAGPRMGSAATSFGSLIHAVAQQATEAGLDLPQNHTAVSDEDNIDEIAQWMISRYKTLRGDLNAIDDPEERYKALGKDAKASVALRNIATYFVKSNRTGYPSNNTETITVGTLDHAEAERQFAARFDFDDILDAYNAIDGNRVQGGDLRIVDVNGDGIIDDKDITPTGFSNVPRFAFSSNLSFGYKGFEISALLTGSAQGTFNMNGYLITPFAQGNGTPLSYMNGRWTPERHAAGKQITFPRMSVNMANSQNNQNNSFWFRSTDHIKLKNVEVAYTFRNARWMRKAHIGSIRVFVNANNLCTWGGKDLVDGIDPELVQDGSTSEGIIYPLTRVYNFGFNIQF